MAAEEIARQHAAVNGEQVADCTIGLPVVSDGRISEIKARFKLAEDSVLRLEMQDAAGVHGQTKYLTAFLN